MSKIISWPKDTVPLELVSKMLDFYRQQTPYDQHFKGKDLRGLPPTRSELPELYAFIETLGYTILDDTPSGNYLETAGQYPIHVDTGKGRNHSLDYTIFLFPLYLPKDSISYLILLNQTWLGEATTFTKQPWTKGWNNMVTDYTDVQGIEYNKWDLRLNELGIIFTDLTLNGMSIDTIISWKVGSIVSFPCNQLHFSVTNSSIPKIGLSLRLKCK
jgi:hypothetical protein